MISIWHFAPETPSRYRVMRFVCITSLSVGHKISRAVFLFTLYMMSARSWHMYGSFPTAVLHTARLSFSSSSSDSVFGVLLTLVVATGFDSSSPRTAIKSRIPFHRVSSGSDDNSAKKEYLVVQLYQSSHAAHHDLSRQMLNQPFNFNARVKQQPIINVNARIDVQFNTSETTRICHRLPETQACQESHNMLVPQFRCSTISIQCFFAMSTLRVRTTLTLLVALQTGVGQRRREGILCARHLQLRCSHFLYDCFLHARSQPTLFSEMVSVQTSRAECARGHD